MSAPAAPRKLIQIKHALAKSTQCLSWEGGHAGGLRRSGRTSVRVNSRPAVIHAVEIADLVTPLAGVRVLEGPQARCSSAQGDLPSQERRSWPEGLGGVRDKLLGSKISGHRPELAAQLGARRAVLRLPRKRAADHLHEPASVASVTSTRLPEWTS